MAHPLLNGGDRLSGAALVPGPVEVFRGDAELHDEIVREILWRDLTALFPPQANEVVLVAPMMMRASEPPMKWRRS
jgi:hypothetical protein